MIEYCGLVTQHTGKKDDNGDEKILSDKIFQENIDSAMDFYKTRNTDAKNKPEVSFESNRKVIILSGFMNPLSNEWILKPGVILQVIYRELLK